MQPSQVHNQWHLAPHGAVQTPPPSSSRTFSLSQRKPCTHGLPRPAPAPSPRQAPVYFPSPWICLLWARKSGDTWSPRLALFHPVPHFRGSSTLWRVSVPRSSLGEYRSLAWLPRGSLLCAPGLTPGSVSLGSSRAGICWVPCRRAGAHRVLAALGGGSRHRPPSRTRVPGGAGAGLDPASGSGVHALASAAGGWEKDGVLGLLGSRMCDGHSSESSPLLTYSNTWLSCQPMRRPVPRAQADRVPRGLVLPCCSELTRAGLPASHLPKGVPGAGRHADVHLGWGTPTPAPQQLSCPR